MVDTPGDGLITRLIGAAVGDTEPGDKIAMVERLFATLPVESQERLLRELLDQLGSEKKETTTKEPAPPMRGPGPPFMWESMDNLPFRNIGPWQMCCRMMANVDQAQTVDDVDAELPAEVFGALGDETRIKIIRLLQDDERQADDIARTLDIPRSTLSHHLRVLRDAGLIQITRRGRGSFCSLTQTKDEA
ncbi:MAG: metalloregulator ArsR/SmtB family transcription factor [Acidimicrobiia bacterium]|nr:metalloregulator ArsR/SmtB family transcription factor [Acidimicrobiia bacterium]